MTRVTRAQAKRRRAFAALSVVTVLAFAVILWPKGSSGGAAAPTQTPRSTSSVARPDSATPPDALSVWLAWVSGGFPESFRQRIDSAGGGRRDVVVRGDHRWVTR